MWRQRRTDKRTFTSIIKTIKKKTERKKFQDMRGRHTKMSRLEKKRRLLENMEWRSSPRNCNSCGVGLDAAIKTSDGSALVCKSCGVVDDMPIFDNDEISFCCIPGSPLYRHRYYFGERILQAKNREPRFSNKELDLLSIVFNLYANNSEVVWSERFFTKKHMSMICKHLINRFPGSFWTRRVERWFQYRTYLCGETGLQLPENISLRLRELFDAYSFYFQYYVKYSIKLKTNITQLDMVILVLLYSLNPSYLPAFGWYFLNRNLVNKTPSVYKNYGRVKEICAMVNRRILSEYDASIPRECYNWFRSGNRITVPDLEDLVNGALGSELGAIQYANYCKGNASGAYHFYNKYKTKCNSV